MATQADVRRLALALPGAQESSERFGFFVRNGAKDKGFAWVWLQRVDPRKPRVPCPDVLAVRVANNDAKEMLLLAAPTKFFTEPHYNGFPAVLVRLKEMSVAEMRELLREAWAIQAPKAVTQMRNAKPATPAEAKVLVKRAEVPAKRTEVPVTRAEVPAKRGEVPVTRAKVPAKRAEVPAKRAKVPAKRAKVAAKRARVTPNKRTSRRPKASV